MRADRFVVLGLARARAPWFGEVTRWATSGALAVEFVKAVSVDEARVRLASGRTFSALLVDGSLPGVDRDLLEAAVAAGAAVIVVDGRGGRDWSQLGAAGVLQPDFGRLDLDLALAEHARAVGRVDDVPGGVPRALQAGGFRARTVVVTGPGGTGVSVAAAAVAQGLAADVANRGALVVADLALHAEQALLHGLDGITSGVPELVEAHRGGILPVDEVRALAVPVPGRGYHLLAGLRRHRDWTALRPRAVDAALDSLRRSFRIVVADVGADLEGEAETGSADVADRNALARTAVAAADVVVVVGGGAGIKGLHSMLRVVRDLLAAGVPADRIVPVVNRAPRRAAARARVARSAAELLQASHPHVRVLSPVFVPEIRSLDDDLHDAVPLPGALVGPLTSAVTARLAAVPPRAAAARDVPVPVVPGSLGSWADEDER